MWTPSESMGMSWACEMLAKTLEKAWPPAKTV